MDFLHQFFFFFLLINTVQFGYCDSEESSAANLPLNDDVLGLIVFKSSIYDPYSYLSSWNEDDTTPCSWNFIKCNPFNGRVTDLSIDGLNLSGKIGRGLQKLQYLKVLSLSNNNFSGPISSDIPFIQTLEKLNLSRNSLTGLIPFSTLNNIKFLDLSQNLLSGPLMDDMFQNCSTLRLLSLSDNRLEGPLPSTLSKCTTLSNLNLSNNHFSGNYPTGIWSFTRLRTLDLSRNSLSGEVPVGVSAVHNLKELSLQGNWLSGFVPADIGFCPHLSKLDLSDNLFEGTLPNSLQRLNSLTLLNLSNNKLTGDFPQWIGKMSALQSVDFSSNGLTGSIPFSIRDLKSLSYLSLSDNNFKGSIPEELFDLGLVHVDLARNEISGSIPSGSSKIFENLQVLDLSGNWLIGDIPAEMGLYSKLRYLNLSWNNFETRIPPEIGYFQDLSVVDLRYSSLFGSIPGDICDSGSLGILQLDGNSLTGPIPQEIQNCSSLFLLSLSHNNLSGSIPKSISMLKKLKILKLELNNLSGEIPQELGSLQSLLAVNISYNRLQGRLPVAGIFQSLDPSSLIGNLGICSPLLKGPCMMNVPKPLVLDPNAYNNQMGNNNNGHNHPNSQTLVPTRHHQFLSISAIIAILAAILIGLGVLVISLLNISAKRRLTFVDTALESMCSSSSRSGTFSSGKLILFDSKSTSSSDDWVSGSPETLLTKTAVIGTGVYGTVYKAFLGGQEGPVVAIKKLVTSNIIKYQEDFDREVRILAKARHPNLIELKGYYWTPQMQLLVSEFAPNGNLQSRLQDLTWHNRFKILLGTAKGLAHLHHSFRPAIIHYNVKPSNVMLDENMNPKLSDFGLIRLVTRLEKDVRFESALGYAAPELARQSLRVNEKCDVYGYGVMILEVVTGKNAIEYRDDENNVVVLKDYVRVLLEEGNVLECVDRRMGVFPDEEVLPVLKLALVCTSQIPSSRPSMSEVVQILQVIKTPIPHRIEAF